MYLVYNKNKGFKCVVKKNNNIIGLDYDFKINENTIFFSVFQEAKDNCEEKDIVLQKPEQKAYEDPFE